MATVSWNPVAGAVSYTLFVQPGSGGAFSPAATLGGHDHQRPCRSAAGCVGGGDGDERVRVECDVVAGAIDDSLIPGGSCVDVAAKPCVGARARSDRARRQWGSASRGPQHFRSRVP